MKVVVRGKKACLGSPCGIQQSAVLATHTSYSPSCHSALLDQNLCTAVHSQFTFVQSFTHLGIHSPAIFQARPRAGYRIVHQINSACPHRSWSFGKLDIHQAIT